MNKNKINRRTLVVLFTTVLCELTSCTNNQHEPLALTTPMYFDWEPREIIRLQRKSLIDGDGKAAHRLYTYYMFGFVNDNARATYWLRVAGSLGNAEALRTLQSMGIKVVKQENKPTGRNRQARFDLTPQEVMRYQSQVGINGDGDAAYNLYLYYQLGHVVDDARATYWLRVAGALGNENALHTLQLMGVDLNNQGYQLDANGNESPDPFGE